MGPMLLCLSNMHSHRSKLTLMLIYLSLVLICFCSVITFAASILSWLLTLACLHLCFTVSAALFAEDDVAFTRAAAANAARVVVGVRGALDAGA